MQTGHAAAIRNKKEKSLTVAELKSFVQELGATFGNLELQYVGQGGDIKTTRVPAEVVERHMNELLLHDGIASLPTDVEGLRALKGSFISRVATYGGYGFAGQSANNAVRDAFDSAVAKLEPTRLRD